MPPLTKAEINYSFLTDFPDNEKNPRFPMMRRRPV